MAPHLDVIAAGLPDLKKYLDPKFLMAAAAAAAVLLILFGARAVLAWSKGRSIGRPPGPGVARLWKAWKEFLAQIPWEFRRSVLRYQPFVVIGESGSGRSTVIAKYTDWKGHAAKFYPSYTQDEALQIYLGSRALIEEMPSALLNDTSPAARRALQRLWEPICSRRDPIVIVCVNATALRQLTPEALRMQAQMIRGKINIMTGLRDKPIETRIVLTHMDHLEGYLAFSQFLERQAIPIHLDVRGAGGTEGCLEPVEKYISLALMSMPAKAYLKVLQFLNKAPETLRFLAIFMGTLVEDDPLTHKPDIRELYLTSAKTGSPTSVSNPFSSQWTGGDLLSDQRTRRLHRTLATGIAAVGLVALLSGYMRERVGIVEASHALAQYEATGDLQYAEDLQQRLATIGGPGAGGWLPRLFSGAHGRDLRERFDGVFREKELLPLVERSAVASNAPEKMLYTLGLLYASNESDLGQLVLAHKSEWAKALGLREALVEAYVRDTEESWAQRLKLPAFRYEHRSMPTNDLQQWTGYFIELHEALDRPVISPGELAALRESAAHLLEGLGQAHRQHSSQRVFALLPWSTSVSGSEMFSGYLEDLAIPPWIVENFDGLSRLLKIVGASRLDDTPPVQNASLQKFLDHVATVQSLTDRTDEVHHFALGTIALDFDAQRWNQLLERSKLRSMAASFMSNEKDMAERLFPLDPYRPVPMPAGSGGFFTGHGEIPGRYTRAAYLESVKPALERFAEANERWQLAPDVRADLARFVSRGVGRYASAYEKALADYYDGWGVRATSIGAAVQLLAQLRQAGSPFRAYLQTVADNTDLEPPAVDLPDAPSGTARPSAIVSVSTPSAVSAATSYLRPFEGKLAAFVPIQRLLRASKGHAAPIDSYGDALDRIEGAISPLAAAPPKAEAKKGEGTKLPEEFESSLTPAAKISYEILVEGRDSEMRFAEEWLHGSGIDGKWREPFLAPIREVHKLGLADMHDAVQKAWFRRVLPIVQPLLARFPFDARAQREATPLELDRALHSSAPFWLAYANMIAPACLGQPGSLRPRPELSSDFTRGMCEVVNQLGTLARTLLDEHGNPQPIVYRLTAGQLPAPERDRPAVILSYLTTGEASVYGFNQPPAQQTLAWRWWEGPPAQVGVQIGDPSGDTDPAYKQIGVGNESMWAFLRLLQKAQTLEPGHVFTFMLPAGQDYPAPKLRFAFVDDPWKLFSIASPQEAARAGN